MKDRILLILTAFASAFSAWAFWHYLGQDALTTLMLLAFISVVADNWRLRRALKMSRSSEIEER